MVCIIVQVAEVEEDTGVHSMILTMELVLMDLTMAPLILPMEAMVVMEEDMVVSINICVCVCVCVVVCNCVRSVV